MSSSLFDRRRRIQLGLAVLVLIGLAVGLGHWWLQRPAPGELRELPKSALTLRDGRLYASGEATPFDGRLFEDFPSSARKLEIEIRNGKAHGRSLGYFDNHQLEVEEFFVDGISHGLRTRWNENGRKMSEEQIEHGKLNGRHVEWHENGNIAVELTLHDNQPEGLAEAWYPDGRLKSRTRFAAGKIINREFFPGGIIPPNPRP